MSCPSSNSIRYNGSHCTCAVGYLLNQTTDTCVLFRADSTISTDSGISTDTLSFFPETIFSFTPLRSSRNPKPSSWKPRLSIWFRLRWWISRLDVCFSTRHWLDDQKVVKKRKTELGGTFSIASWILFIGLFAALLYQIITKRTIEVHNVRATNAPDLASFNNDMEFNITTISSMSCSNLRDLATLVTGNPGFIDFRVAPLSKFGNYSCQNTSRGPMITLRCNNCQPIQDNLYISWQFIDLPNNPAAAVGFQFNLSTRNHANKKHLIQPLFHDFVPGSFFRDTSQLQTSLESSNDGILNTTLYVNFLSAYIVEIDNRNIMGPVSFLADLGGLYCICIGFFSTFWCKIKKLRNEDSVLRKIRNRRKAQEHWDKLRKYVMYTWGCKALNESEKKGSGCIGFNIQSVHRNGSSHKQRQQEMDAISFNRKLSLPNKKTAVQECSHTVGGVRSFTPGTSLNPEESSSHSAVEPPQQIEFLGSTKDGKHECVCLCKEDSSLPKALTLTNDDIIPPPASLELKDASEMDMSDVQKNLRSLYEYNVMLREKLIATRSLFHSLPANSSSSVTAGQT
ncbi:uncharacterized protein Pyn_39539 [Prunus yedoensis var. nudiflora]|uniref:Uncharacterized protein n=1 Tax=Prunus yedoensis var. nudiflora TaxID=2094558 RepID=A0A314ZDC3_PRUYE|nr:uncharacterized protein Pyn_39539 [Prunus yedoensis var. nudiflora]